MSGRRTQFVSPKLPNKVHITKPDFGLWTLDIFRLFSCQDRAFKWNSFEVSHFLELVKAFVDLVVSQLLNTRSSKLLNIERRHHRSENHCATHCSVVQRRLTGQVTHEATGKRVACSGRIKHRLQWISRNCEITLPGKE